MFQRSYKVKGKDVNDFMVMQNASYLYYSSKIVETFLFVKGFTKLKMNSLKVGLQNNSDQIVLYKPLFFTQRFYIDLEFKNIVYSNQKMSISIHFYNENNELCATIIRAFFWFDYTTWHAVAPPKKIANYFTLD